MTQTAPDRWTGRLSDLDTWAGRLSELAQVITRVVAQRMAVDAGEHGPASGIMQLAASQVAGEVIAELSGTPLGEWPTTAGAMATLPTPPASGWYRCAGVHHPNDSHMFRLPEFRPNGDEDPLDLLAMWAQFRPLVAALQAELVRRGVLPPPAETDQVEAGAGLVYALYHSGAEFAATWPDPVTRAYMRACDAYAVGRPRSTGD